MLGYGREKNIQMQTTNYEKDVVAWSREQAELLRAGRWPELDIAHIADEIEDVGKSERRELASRMAVLLAHLLKWRFQPDRQGSSWERTVREQRRGIARCLKQAPSLKGSLEDAEWLESVWGDAVVKAIAETGLDDFPENCFWSISDILDESFYPASAGQAGAKDRKAPLV